MHPCRACTLLLGCLVHPKKSLHSPQAASCTLKVPVPPSQGALALPVPPQRCSVYPKVAYMPPRVPCAPRSCSQSSLREPWRCPLHLKMPTALQEAWCTPKMLAPPIQHAQCTLKVPTVTPTQGAPLVPGAPQSHLPLLPWSVVHPKGVRDPLKCLGHPKGTHPPQSCPVHLLGFPVPNQSCPVHPQICPLHPPRCAVHPKGAQ